MKPSVRIAAFALAIVQPLRGVTPIDVSSLITPAHYFYLEGKTVTFQPRVAASQPGQTTESDGLPYNKGDFGNFWSTTAATGILRDY